jgi:hypothetical protein
MIHPAPHSGNKVVLLTELELESSARDSSRWDSGIRPAHSLSFTGELRFSLGDLRSSNRVGCSKMTFMSFVIRFHRHSIFFHDNYFTIYLAVKKNRNHSTWDNNIFDDNFRNKSISTIQIIIN